MQKRLLKFMLVVSWAALFCLAIGVSLTAVQAQTTQNVRVSTQRFDNGLMIWRSDTSLVWVLTNDGAVRAYPWDAYKQLPDNTYFGNPPDYKRLRPIFAFGQIWGNDEVLRNKIGWPTLPEIGFSTAIQQLGSTSYFTELDQTIIQINANNTWTRLPAGGITPIPTPTSGGREGIQRGIAFQQYERGFMVWSSEDGSVKVYHKVVKAYTGNSDGVYSFYGEDEYKNLPDNPISDIPPGFVRPVNAFGKIWGNIPTVRDNLGHAVAAEQGHNTTIVYEVGGFIVTFDLPDGRIVKEYRNVWWFAPAQ